MFWRSYPENHVLEISENLFKKIFKEVTFSKGVLKNHGSTVRNHGVQEEKDDKLTQTTFYGPHQYIHIEPSDTKRNCSGNHGKG